jgi:hypothetical protein
MAGCGLASGLFSAGAWALDLGPERAVTANYAGAGFVVGAHGLVVAAISMLAGRTG